jgi:NHL repeat
MKHAALLALLLVANSTFAADSATPLLIGHVTTVAGVAGIAGHHDGPAGEATFNRPTWVDVIVGSGCGGDVDGDIYVIDRANESIRKVSAGFVSTYTVPGFDLNFGGPLGGGIMIEPRDGACGCGEYARGMFVASSGTHQVGLLSFVGKLANRDGLQIMGQHGVAGATGALFNNPGGIARSWLYPIYSQPALRTLYIADTGNHLIRRSFFGLSAEACPIVFGSGLFAGVAGIPGSNDGPGPLARFNAPRGIAAAKDGSVYVADTGNHTIRRITPDGTVTTVAGEAGVFGSNDGPALQAHLNTPSGIDVNESGVVFIADTGNDTIRMLTPDGMLQTIAGVAGECGSTDGTLSEARFCTPVGLRLTPDGSLLVADTSNDTIRRVTLTLSRRRLADR